MRRICLSARTPPASAQREAGMSEEGLESDSWDEETMMDLRRFGLEQALMAHLHKRDAQADLTAVFKDADRIVNYVLGDLTP
jgi:hypothetical protein